jgi:hypothetical protein
MYQFSRSIYRELAPYVAEDVAVVGVPTHQRILDACETTMQRLATDRRYFARPARSLFGELRTYFPINEQLRVFRVVERNVRLALDYLERVPPEELMLEGDRECRAHTRKGTPCRREPLPGRDYCPSHKHLEENLDLEGEQLEVSGSRVAPPLGIGD